MMATLASNVGTQIQGGLADRDGILMAAVP